MTDKTEERSYLKRMAANPYAMLQHQHKHRDRCADTFHALRRDLEEALRTAA